MLNDSEFDLSELASIHDLVRNKVWTGRGICGAVEARRALFSEAGAGPGSRVIIAHGGTPEFFADLFAVWSLGACAACVNPALTDSELTNVVAFTEPVALILGERVLQARLSRNVRLITGLALPGDDRESPLILNCRAGDPALILFTSGTTGDPKGVVHDFGSLRARIDYNHRYIAHETLGRSLCVLPTHFGHGLIGNCLTPLFAEADLYLAPGGGVRAAAALGTTVDENEITFMSSVPSFWRIALKMSPPPTRNSLCQINVGSAPVSKELIRAIIEWSGTRDVRNMYGITETANWIAGSSACERVPEDGLVGAMWGGDAAIRTPDGKIMSSGEGELLLRPPALMNGYFRRPDLTAAVMRDGWFSTGDIGRIDHEGFIRLTGRLKHEINRGGMKVSPEEIDLLLERHDGVLEACAFGLPDEIAGEVVAVAVKLDDQVELSAEDLRRWCIEHIRRECVPERWFIVDELPKTDRGKINRDTVREMCLRGEKK